MSQDALDVALTLGMKRALRQIGFGVTARMRGWFDENGDRVDGRCIHTLVRRGLVRCVGGTSVGYAVTDLMLTENGEELFESMR